MSKVDILSALLDISNSEGREFIDKLELLLNRLLVETGDYKTADLLMVSF